MILSSHIASEEDAYTLANWLKDIRKELFGWRLRKLSKAEMTLQKVYVATLISGAEKRVSTTKQTLLNENEAVLHQDTPVCGCHDHDSEDSGFGRAGYNWQSRLNLKAINNSQELFYGELLTLKKKLCDFRRQTPENEYESHYCELLRQIEEAVDTCHDR